MTEPAIAVGMWLTFLAGLALGVIDVLGPLRLNRLGADAAVIAGAFLGSGRRRDRPVAVGRAAWRIDAAAWCRCACPSWPPSPSACSPRCCDPVPVLVVLLVIGLPAFGTLFVPAAAMIGDGADRRQLHHGLAYGLGNLAWASGQGIAAAASGALAQATVDAVPYLLVAATMAATALVLRRRDDRGDDGLMEGGTEASTA